LEGDVAAAGAGAGAAAAVGIGFPAGWEEEVDMQDHGRVGSVGMKEDGVDLGREEMRSGKRNRGSERERVRE
jgi:hypothetical protein